MATMYELLSQRPVTVPGQRTSYTAQWDEKQIRSRDYIVPVRRNKRNTVQRTRKHTDDDSAEEAAAAAAAAEAAVEEKTQGDKTEKPRNRHSLKAVVGLLMLGNDEHTGITG